MSFITDGGDVKINIIGDLDNLSRSMDDASASVEQRFGAISRTAGIAMTAVGGAIVGVLGLGVNAAAEFDQAIMNAVSVTGLTGEAADKAREKMEGLALALGQQTAFSAKEAANAFYDLNSKGLNAANMSVEELLPILNLAAASQKDLTFTTEITTATMKAFGMQNSELTRIADVYTAASGKSAASLDLLSASMPIVGSTAHLLGVSLEEVVSILSTLYDRGIEGSTAATGFRNIMLDITNGTPAFSSGLKSMELTLDDLNIKQNGVAGAFEIMKERGLTTELAMKMFGKESANVAAILLDSSSTIDQFSNDLKNVGGTAQTIAEMQLSTLSGQMKILYGSIESVLIPLGKALVPTLKDLAQALIPVVNGLSAWMMVHPQLAKWIVTVTGAVGGLMFVFGPLLIMLPGLTAAWTALAGAGPLVSAAFTAITTSGVGAIATIAGPAGLAAAFIFATYEIMAAINAIREYNAAQEDLARRNEAWAEENEILIDGLRRHGVAVEELGIKHLDVTAQQQALGAVLEELRMREAAGYDLVGGAAQEAYQRAAQAAVQSAGEQQQAWGGVLGVLESILSLPLDLLRWINGAGGPQAAERGGVIGFPGYDSGGRVGVDMQPFRWNERGGEIAVAPVGTRILPHDQAVTVARDAIAQAMSGGMGGGPTININSPVVRNESDLRRIADYVMGALDGAYNTAAGRGGVINAYG